MIRNPWIGLAVLFAVYTLNFLDRSAIYILFGPIRRELALSDLQLALLGSTAFVLFYTTLGVPFGRLADRVNRVRMIAIGLAVWSIASAATGLAGSFPALVACRIAVGVGEATLGPAAFSLLADWFPPARRATASALFAAGIPLGAGLALGLGGVLADQVGWRWVFPILGLPGVVLAGLVLLLPEPVRGAVDAGAPPSPSSAWTVLRSSKTLPLHVTGYAVLAIAANAWGMWLPTYLSGRWDRSLAEVGLYVGGCAVVGGLIGTVAGGWAADALQRRHPGGRLVFGAATATLSGLAWLVLLSTDQFGVAIGACAVGMGLGLAWLGPASADVQDLVPAAHRGTAISVYYLGVNVVGYGLGPPLIGALNDQLGTAADPSRMAVSLALCPIACAVATLILATAGLRRGRIAARSPLPTA